jgi:hypothetical protein
MTITSYIRTIFKQSPRTAWRRKEDVKELRKHWPDKVIMMVAAKGAELLRGAAGVGVKDLINVAKALPPPSSKEEKVIEGYVMNDVREKMREQRSGRRTGKAVRLSNDDSAKIAFNTVNRLLRSTRLKTSAEKRRWLHTVSGWTMEAHAIPGTMRVGRISIPEGVIAKVGRPRKEATV